MTRRGIRRLFRFPSRTKTDIRTDIDDELRFHLDMRIADLIRDGLAEHDARAQAAREFGDADRSARQLAARGVTIERQRWLARYGSELKQDAAYGWRLIVRSPGFSAVAIATLAVAIGGNTAIFSVVNALVFKPAPFAAPRELARIRPGESQMSWPNYQDVRARSTSFADITAHRSAMMTPSESDGAGRLMGQAVAANFFTILGVPAARGRTMLPSDVRTDVVVLSDRVWRNRFGADPSIVGRALSLDGRPHEVLGVMPPLFRGIAPPGLLLEFWVPVDVTGADRRMQDRAARRFEIVGRLKPGIGLAQAAAEVQVVASQLRAEHPDVNERFASTQVFAIDGFEAFRGAAGTLMPVFAFLALMTLVAGFVLFIGCANIAGLLLGRAAARRREIAVRLALGAGRGRLVRQLLTESLLLALAGGTAGMLLAVWLSGTLNLFAARLPFPVEFDLALDRRVLGYALALSGLTALIFGLAPARRASRIDLVPSLKDDGGSARRQRMRQTLVIGQVALCTLLLVWGGLFTRSLERAIGVDPGFDPSNVVVADIGLGEAIDDADKSDAIFVELQRRLEQVPGVESAGMSSVVPLALMGREEFRVTMVEADSSGVRPWVHGNRITPGWFRTVRIPLLAGRDFTWQDRKGAPEVAIVNDTLARLLFNGDAVGRRLKYPDAEIVGVVADSKYWTIGETISPTVYRPYRQTLVDTMNLHVRTTNLSAAAQAVRTALRQLAPGVAPDIKPMSRAIAAATMPSRAGALFTGGFGLIAALLATLGIYGLVSFSVLQRTKEIGVRKAIGAGSSQIIRLVVGGSAGLVAVGLAAGLGLGIVGGLALRGLIVDTSPADPLTLAGVSLLVMGAAVAASAMPALRATRVDPLVALRNE
jgi:predicted permease